jgi:hypothetical protein
MLRLMVRLMMLGRELRLRLRLMRKRLRIARQIGLRIARAEGRFAAADARLLAAILVVAVLERFVVGIVVGTLELRAVDPELFLRGGDQAEIVLGVLIIILRCNRIAGRLRIAGKLNILFRNMRGSASDFHIGPIRFIDPRHRVLTLAVVVAAAHALLVLSVSHDSPVC